MVVLLLLLLLLSRVFLYIFLFSFDYFPCRFFVAWAWLWRAQNNFAFRFKEIPGRVTYSRWMVGSDGLITHSLPCCSGLDRDRFEIDSGSVCGRFRIQLSLMQDQFRVDSWFIWNQFRVGLFDFISRFQIWTDLGKRIRNATCTCMRRYDIR